MTDINEPFPEYIAEREPNDARFDKKLMVTPLGNGLYMDRKYGMILKWISHDKIYVIGIYENEAPRDLTEEEKQLALSLNFMVGDPAPDDH